MSAAKSDSLGRLVGDLISELESESARWTEERRKVENGGDPNIGTAICDAKANAYADAAFRVRRAAGIAPPDACGFRSANTRDEALYPVSSNDWFGGDRRF